MLFNKKPKIGLALGAGGARGLAHIGVIEELDSSGIEVDIIVGSSMGAMIGALYADSKSTKQLKAKLLHLSKKDFVDISFTNIVSSLFKAKGTFKVDKIEKFMIDNLSTNKFHELAIQFAAIATDINNGDSVIISSGDVAKSVQASCALTPLFSPFLHQKRFLVDGGFSQPVPVEAARALGADIVIAVDVSSLASYKKPNNIFNLSFKSLSIQYATLSKMQASLADIIIKPDVEKFDVLDDKHNNEIYLRGKAAAATKIKELKKIIKNWKN